MASVDSMAPRPPPLLLPLPLPPEADNADRLIFRSGIDQSLQEEANEIQPSTMALSFGSNQQPSNGLALEDELRHLLISLSSLSFNSTTNSSIASSFSTNPPSLTSSFIDQINYIGSPTAVSLTATGAQPDESIFFIQSIVEQMIASGREQQCIQEYIKIRKVAVDASFKKLGIEKVSIGDMQMLESDCLDKIVRRWILAARTCFRELFVTEKNLFEYLFESSSLGTDIKHTYFMETVNGPARQLLSFAQTVSSSRRSPEKLFSILKLYVALSDLLPDIQMIFNPIHPNRVVAIETLAKLAGVSRVILSEFENAVLHEISTILIPGGSIHHMTRYVMNYMKKMVVFKQTLIELTVSKPGPLELVISGDLIKDFVLLDAEQTEPNQPDQEGKTNLGLHFKWIATVLQFKLEEKSKLYEDDSLAHLFMMNNIYYMFQKIYSKYELKEMIGEDYLRKLTRKYRQAASKYLRSTWARVLYCLRDEGLGSGSFSSSGVSMSALRQRFKTFNAMFQEVHRTQATWLVPDAQLREELLISISQNLIQGYRSFLGRYSSYIENSRWHPENYIRYSVEDLEVALQDFFGGYSVSQHFRSRSQLKG